MQTRAWAITVMQGGGTPGPLIAVAVPMARVCERCMVLLQEPEGCVVSEQGKARACLPCQKVRKACVWPLGLGGAGAATGSGTEASEEEGREDCDERIAQRWGEVQEGAHDDDETEEVFGVPRVMAEEQCDTLGMLTQALVQVAEKMAAAEARDEERLALEREMVEIWRAHLAMARRAVDHEEE